jgi:hypothetical protein
MTLKEEILLNQYGQRIIALNDILSEFENKTLKEKRSFLEYLYSMICQSKIQEEDIEKIIQDSGLKSTYTPCILLKKGIKKHHFYKIINLPENELTKACILLLSAFRIPYERRFEIEKGNYKWWYWDLSIEENISKVKKGDLPQK